MPLTQKDSTLKGPASDSEKKKNTTHFDTAVLKTTLNISLKTLQARTEFGGGNWIGLCCFKSDAYLCYLPDFCRIPTKYFVSLW